MSVKMAARAAAAVTAVPVAFMIKRKTENPESGWANIAINTVLVPTYTFKSGPFEKEFTLDNVMESAKAESKLSDFGTSDPAELFRSTVELMNTPAFKSLELSPFGVLAIQGSFNNNMVAYLKQIQYLKDVPAVLQQQIKSPVFVVGLFRSGTTNLHRLLALDPAHRSPLLWELGTPSPDILSTIAADLIKDRKARRDKFVEGIDIGRSIGDWERFDAMHKVDSDLPEECQVSFGSIVPNTLGPFFYASVTTPGVTDDLQMAAAYPHYKKILQMLQYQDNLIGANTPKRWVMKGPLHLFDTKALGQTFPDAQLVWIHRDPASSVPSLCSMVDLMAQLYCEDGSIDRSWIGKGVKALTEKVLTRAPTDIQESGLSCCHVKYDNVVRDPVNTIKKIYDFHKWEYTEEYDKLLKEYVEKDAKERAAQSKGVKSGHAYSLEKYGLSKADFRGEESDLGKYMKRFELEQK